MEWTYQCVNHEEYWVSKYKTLVITYIYNKHKSTLSNGW